MGKDGFGVADNLSTPSNSMPSTPVDTLDSHGVSSVTGGNSNAVSASLEPTPLITESKAIDLTKPIASQQRKVFATESIVQQMITSISSSAVALGDSAEEAALVRILKQESERGSNHSLASADLDLQLDAREDFSKSEEGSLNEHLSAHGLAEVTFHVNVYCLSFSFLLPLFLLCTSLLLANHPPLQRIKFIHYSSPLYLFFSPFYTTPFSSLTSLLFNAFFTFSRTRR